MAAQAPTIARTDAQFMRDILSLDRGRETFEELLPEYLDLFRQNDFDGEPGYSLKDREMYVDAWAAKLLSERMQDFLKDDLNGDLTVTLEELRVSLTRGAYNHLRIRRNDRTPVPEAVQKYIAKKTTAYLQSFDLDGDETVSFDEARVKAREISQHAASKTVPIPRMAPSLAHDLDGDTTISEQEMIALAKQVFDTYDANGSGIIEPVERELASKMRKTPPAFMFGQARTASREVEGPTCPFPRGDEDLAYYMIGGFEGAAMTNLHFENPNEAVEAVRIEVPEEGPPIRLIAAFQSGTILWIEDPGLRVKTVYDTRGPVALFGSKRPRLVRTDPSCHLELWKPISSDNPDPRAFYAQVTRKAPVGVVSGYTLGLIDLGTLENNHRKHFPSRFEIDLGGPAIDLWAHFLRFNPGGIVMINPNFVRYSGDLGEHPILPQYAGLATLVEEGALSLLDRDGRIDGVSGSRFSVTLQGRTFRPGGGDDAIRTGGFVYRYEREGSWTGRAPLEFRIEDAIAYPAGLTGAHAVEFVLPAEVPMPIGDAGQSTLSIEDPGTLLEE